MVTAGGLIPQRYLEIDASIVRARAVGRAMREERKGCQCESDKEC